MSKLQETIAARKRAAIVIPANPEPIEPEVDYSEYAALIPEADPIDENFVKDNETVDTLIENLGVVGAYKEFIGKMTPKVGRKSESIMCSCPLPWHEDKNPSAWMNSDKNTWFCGGCQRGGDIYDLAAIGLQFDIDTYKTNSFVELRQAIAAHFGYEIFQAPGVEDSIYKPEPVAAVVDTPTNGHVVITDKITTKEFDPEEELNLRVEEKLNSSEDYVLDWRSVVVPHTFLWDYMEACTKDYNVEEYHFWNAMIALGMAVGRNVYANDTPHVYANLFVCLMGGSGSGKTKSRRYLDSITNRVLPFKESMDYPDGVKEIPTPNSAEYLIKMFSHPVMGVDPMGSPVVTDFAPVRGIIRFEELSSFKAIAGRSGSDLGSRMLEFYDCKDRVTTGSRQTGDTIANYPFASALTTTQPRSLSKLLSQQDEDSGFLNRWLFVGGRQKEGRFWGEVRIDLSDAEKKLFGIHIWANDERIVTLSREAEWQANRDLKSFIAPDKDKHDPALGRIDLTVKKICLLFAINEKSTEITLDIYNRAMLLYPYIKAYAIFRSEYLEAETQQSQAESAVVSKIKSFYSRTGTWPTARDLLRALGTRKIRGSRELDQILVSLTKMEVIKAISTAPKAGKRIVQYAVETEE